MYLSLKPICVDCFNYKAVSNSVLVLTLTAGVAKVNYFIRD